MDETLEVARLSDADHGAALVTIHEAAATLRLSETSVWRRIRDGQLEAVRLGAPGSAVRIRARSVRDLMRPYDEEDVANA